MIGDLLQRLYRSDRKAWGYFVDRAYPVIEATWRRVTGPDQSGDGPQKVFEMLIREDYALLRRFRGETELSLLAYVKQIAYNAALNERKKARENATDPEILAEIIPDPEKDSLISASQLRSALIESAETLDLKYREVMLLRIDGYSHREIAEITGITLNTVLTRMKRAREQMRDRLKESFF
ncbi:MAG: RNA polymerase sigma factor [Leptospiraceae bacterium]|nr:RNA polymerase sigma factor [Leptospiraceae bacterium]